MRVYNREIKDPAFMWEGFTTNKKIGYRIYGDTIIDIYTTAMNAGICNGEEWEQDAENAREMGDFGEFRPSDSEIMDYMERDDAQAYYQKFYRWDSESEEWEEIW